jgi:hypothetical protein
MWVTFCSWPTLRLLLVGYLTLSCLPAQATTYYVRKTGSDTNSGTSPIAAFQTIGAAAQTMIAGDSVWIGAGTYSEQVRCANSGSSGHVISYQGDTTGVNTGDAGSVTISSGGVPLNGNGASFIAIVGITTSGGNPGMSFVGGANISLQSCDVSGANNGVIIDHAALSMTSCASHNNSGQGVDVVGNANVTITACNFYSNTAYGLYVGPSGSPNVTMGRTLMNDNTSGGLSATNGTVVACNCIVYDSWDGIDIWDGYSGYTGGNVTLYNCVVTDSHDDATWINAGSLTIVNTIIAFNHSWGINVWGGSCTHTYNAFWSDGYGLYNATAGDVGEIQADPMFADEPGHDFHLNPGSPCIDVGATLSSVPVDYVNNVRPYGTAYDMGVYEVGSSPAPTRHGVRVIKWIEIQ